MRSVVVQLERKSAKGKHSERITLADFTSSGHIDEQLADRGIITAIRTGRGTKDDEKIPGDWNPAGGGAVYVWKSEEERYEQSRVI